VQGHRPTSATSAFQPTRDIRAAKHGHIPPPVRYRGECRRARSNKARDLKGLNPAPGHPSLGVTQITGVPPNLRR
jgi:hypothetical protein